MRDDFSYRQPAHAPLARAHPTAPERFRLIGAQATQGNETAHFTRGDFFAATDNDVVGRNTVCVARPVQAVEKRADALQVSELATMDRSFAIARRPVDRAELLGHGEPGEGALDGRRLRR